MAKLTAQEKIQSVKKCLEGKEGQRSVARNFGVTLGIFPVREATAISNFTKAARKIPFHLFNL
ncbi:hypothetical protein [Paenibacillus thalictri]|uniref:hypothetical protein n=1 Tax=Paenibacillus thalictri TaxID=2527873 RepID=UPI0013EEF92F|nr:hypothetical protein [Paenibacillus thalictri]